MKSERDRYATVDRSKDAPTLTFVAEDPPQRGLYKVCDGKRLVYMYYDARGAAVAVVENAVECANG